MKTIFQTLIMVALLATSSMASHITGGEISYRYIGDSTNIPHQYEVSLHLFRDARGTNLPTNVAVCYTSGCFNTGSAMLTQVAGGTGPGGGRLFPNYNGCANDSTDPNWVMQYIHTYRGVVTLPGKCSDVRFTYATCCRNHAITNLQSPGSKGFIISAMLNNLNGPNSSAKMHVPTQKSLCVLQASDQPFGLSFSAKDTDGDSLHYSLNQPLGGSTNCSSLNWTPITWMPGLGRTQPLHTHQGVSFNSSTGLMLLSPDRPQVVVLSVMVSEYRYDSTLAAYYQVGSTVREQQTPILSRCSRDITNLVIDSSSLGTANGLALQCGDSILEIEFTRNFNCNSIAADGSDFALINSLGQLVPVVGASGVSCTNTIYSKKIRLQLHQPVAVNDTLTLVGRTGSDLNFLKNNCHQEFNPMPAQQVVISGCSTSVSLDEHLWSQMQLYPNPAGDRVSISFSSASSDRVLQLLDINGKIVLQIDAREPAVNLDLSFLPKGMYLVRCTENDQSETAQLFKN